MPNKKIFSTSAILILTLLGSSALAASFDFNNLADTYASFGGTGESAWTSFTWTDDGITLTATARDLANTSDYFVYMDAGNAGMGACKSVLGGATPNVGRNSFSNQCAPAGDDDLGFGEVLVFEFSEEVSLDLSFLNGAHDTDFRGTFGLFVGEGNPTSFTDFTLFALNSEVEQVAVGTRFQLIADESISGILKKNRQMYISGMTATPTVPEPSTVTLFGSGLAGMAAWRLRRQANNDQKR